jgi:putative transcriptional regulator
MTKTAFDKIAAGLKEAVAITKGEAHPGSYRVHVPDRLDVRAIRAKTGLSQQAFADRFGFPVATLRDWEQGRRGPETSARLLLTVIDKEPEAVRRALAFG